MMVKNLTCITCPMGCALEASCETTEDGGLQILSVKGNTCPRGEKYARAELTHPERMVTSTVALKGGPYKRLPVITSAPVPKERIFEVMEAIHAVTVCAPVNISDLIIENVCGLGVDVVASRSIRSL